MLFETLAFLTAAVRAYNEHQGSSSAVEWYKGLSRRDKAVVEPLLVEYAMRVYGSTELPPDQANRVFEFVKAELGC